MSAADPEDVAGLIACLATVTLNVELMTDRLDNHSECLDAVVLAIKSLENRMERVEARLAAAERAIPWKAPPKPKPPKLPPRRPGI